MNYEDKVQNLVNKMRDELWSKVPALKAKIEALHNSGDKSADAWQYSAVASDHRMRYDLTMKKTVYDYNRKFKHIIIDQVYGTDTLKLGDNTWLDDVSPMAVATVLDYVNEILK